MPEQLKELSVARNIKIAFFHLGSGMADVLTTGVWNRVMISDLGINATPVSLLVSLRYFLAPLGIWAGRVSDRRRIFGLRRLFWVWFGRALMVLSTFGIGFGTAGLMQAMPDGAALNWMLIVGSLVMFSLGNALSGSTFLALIYDRATDEQRGRAVGIVWTFLLLGFTVGGVVFSLLLRSDESAGALGYSTGDLVRLFVISGLMFLGLWFFSLLGEERRDTNPNTAASGEQESASGSMLGDLRLVWQHPSMRFFLFYLSLSMFFAFSQDPVLEPFAADVFGLEAETTNRFAAYWGSTSILGSVLSLYLLRKTRYFTHTTLSLWGVVILLATFGLLVVSALGGIQAILMPGLLLLGLGLGLWNIGTLGLMMDMSPLGRAGTFLGFWSMVVTLSRGGGIAWGGIVRDVGFAFSDTPGLAYGLVFGIAVVGLLVALYSLSNVRVEVFKAEASEDADTATILAGAMD